MTLISPSDLGLPAKFSSFYPNQERLILNIAASDYRFSGLSAPTGTGKSLIYVGVAKMLGGRALVLVGTKGLQQQLMRDFAAIGMVDIMGQKNYQCVALNRGQALSAYGPPSHCGDGPCHIGVYCKMRNGTGCKYFDARNKAHDAEIVVANYSYWLTIGQYSDPLAIGNFNLLILDEAHTAPDWLADHCAVEIRESEIRAALGIDLPPVDEGVKAWTEWATATLALCRKHIEDLKGSLEGISDRHIVTRRLIRLSFLERNLDKLSHAHLWRNGEGPRRDARVPGMTTDWVMEEQDYGVKFSPIWAHPYAEEYLFRGIKRVVLASATLPPAVAKYIGIGSKEWDYHEEAVGFDPSRRPFIYIPTVRVDYRMTAGERRIWLRQIDEIIAGRLDRSGIIHTSSYERVRYIVENSKYSDRMMTHSSWNTQQVVADFKASSTPKILVSPALEEGHDFPGGECMFVIVVKVPFPDSRGMLAKARHKSDPNHKNFVTSLRIIQMAGRAMRSKDDLCEIFMIDDHWKWFKNKGSFPGWFKKAWKWSEMTPAPPPVPIQWRKKQMATRTGK